MSAHPPQPPHDPPPPGAGGPPPGGELPQPQWPAASPPGGPAYPPVPQPPQQQPYAGPPYQQPPYPQPPYPQQPYAQQPYPQQGYPPPGPKPKALGGLGYGVGLLAGIGSVVLVGLVTSALTKIGVSSSLASFVAVGGLAFGLALWALGVPRHRRIIGGIVLGMVLTYVIIAAVAALLFVVLAGMCIAGMA